MTRMKFPAARAQWRTYSLILLLGILLIGTGLYGELLRTDSHVIIRTENGFVPAKSFVAAGDTVRFKNENAAVIRPESNSTPRYEEFDAPEDIAPGATWEFVFDKPGIWDFHDEHDKSMVGTVVVYDDAGKSIENCLEGNTDTIVANCWEGEVYRLINTAGLGVVLTQISDWYESMPKFRGNCHDVMHIVGVAAYAEFVKDNAVHDDPATSSCGYGFYHGFIEEMIRERGFDFGIALDYCDAVDRLGAKGPCQHGIGHAVFDSIALDEPTDVRMTGRSLDICESISGDAEFRRQCASGVFNALANAYGEQRYGISYETGLGPKLCATMGETYAQQCYMEVGTNYVYNKGSTREERLAVIRTLPYPGYLQTIIGFMDTEVKREMANIDVNEFAEFCESLSPHEALACVDGTATGMYVVGSPQARYAVIERFCEALSKGETRAFCVEQIPRGREKQ